MTYKPNPDWRVVWNPGGPDVGVLCTLVGQSVTSRHRCQGNERGFFYVDPSGRWTHTRCWHRANGFPVVLLPATKVVS